MAEIATKARAVVIGGGVSGCSVAYHLAKAGWTDVVLLERRRLTSGTTWHAAGLVGQLRASESGTRLVQYSTQLYAELEAETGLSAGYKQCGGVTVARTEDRMVQLRRTAANAAAYDAVYMLRDAMRRVGTDRQKLRDAFAGIGTTSPAYEGAMGTIAFDANGDVPSLKIYVGEVRDGAMQLAEGQ